MTYFISSPILADPDGDSSYACNPPRRRGGVATQRPAKPFTPVRFRSAPYPEPLARQVRADRPDGREDLVDRRKVAGVLGEVGVADRSVRRDHEHAAELGGMVEDLPLVDGDAALAHPRGHRVLDPARHRPGVDELGERGQLGPGRLEGRRVGSEYTLTSTDCARRNRLASSAVPWPTSARCAPTAANRSREWCRLHCLRAAEHASVMAQEHEDDGLVAPQVAEADVIPEVILDDQVLEVSGVQRRARLLRCLHRLKHPLTISLTGVHFSARGRSGRNLRAIRVDRPGGERRPLRYRSLWPASESPTTP